MKRLLMMIAAIACLMLTSHAAPTPVCPPDDIDEALELMGAKTPEQKLDMVITMLNNVYEKEGDYIKVLKDDAANKVVMLVNGDNMGFDRSVMKPEMTDLVKSVFMSSMFEEDEDGEITALLNVIINSGRSLEIRIYNDNDISDAVSILYTPSEMRRAIEEHGSGGSVSPDDGFDSIFADDGDPEAALKRIVDIMEEYMSSSTGMDAHVWIDPHAKRVVMSMTSDDFAEVKEYREMAFMFKTLFLQSLLESDHEFLNLVTRTGRGLRVMLCPPDDVDNPMVLDYSVEELMEALSDE